MANTSAQAVAAPDAVIERASEMSLLDKIINDAKMAADHVEQARARDLIQELVEQVLAGAVVVSKDLAASIDARVAQLDKLISDQLNAIMHTPDFQQLEGSWRGLHHLVTSTEHGPLLKINVLNANKKELVKDFRNSPDFDQSTLFKKIYEEEYGTFGGAPYAALLGDFSFTRNAEDFYLLEQISHVAAAAHAPFIAAADCQLFGLDSYTDISKPRDLGKTFETLEYAKWRGFRDSDDSRYVGLTLPRVLARLPYGADMLPVEEFNFTEDVAGASHDKYLWTSAAYALGVRLTHAFSNYGWCAAIRGLEGGGLVDGLPTHTFRTDDGEIALKCPTEVAITDRNEKQLAELGFIPLVHCKNTDYAAFFSTQSTQRAKIYSNDAANANARLSTQLQYIMSVSRVAHYLKAIMRDKVGSFASKGSVETFLNNWLSQYVLLDDSASQEAKAKFPLREARVDVIEVPGKPGVFKAAAFLRPHYQLDELTISLRLVAELPQAAR